MRSIRTRLLAGTAIGVALAFVITGVLVLVLTRSSLFAQFDQGLIARARTLSALVEHDGVSFDTDLDGEREIARGESYEVWDDVGNVIVRAKGLGSHDLERPYPDGSIRTVTLPDGREGRQITMRFQVRAEDAPPDSPPMHAVIAVAGGTETIEDTIGRLGRVLIGVGLAGTLLCLVILAWVVRFGLAPVRALAASIAEIREGDLAARLATATTPAELRPVVDRLNELLARLGVAFSRERELTAEVAHELRTPLAGLRATIEVAIDRDRPAEKYRAALAECLAICTQTERVVETLLSLARLDAGTVAASSEPVELDELVREVLAPLSARATERRLDVTTDLPPITLERSDRDKLRVILTNLLDNAVSYANDGGAIRIELSATMVRISNTGCTLTESEVTHVFERFWRGDAARTTGTHAGLGLALCKKLVDLLGGTISAQVLDQSTTRSFVVTVRL